MSLCCENVSRWISEFDTIQDSLRDYVSSGHMVTVEDIVDQIKAEAGNEIPDSCLWVVVNLAVAMLRLVMLSPV